MAESRQPSDSDKMETLRDEEMRRLREWIRKVSEEIKRAGEERLQNFKEIKRAGEERLQNFNEELRKIDEEYRALARLPDEIRRMDKRSRELYETSLKDGQVPVFNIRIMIVGHYGVGKTSLTNQLFGDQDSVHMKQQSTDGIDVHIRRCQVTENGKWIPHPYTDPRTATLAKLKHAMNQYKQFQQSNTTSQNDKTTFSTTDRTKVAEDITIAPDIEKATIQKLYEELERIDTRTDLLADLSVWDFAGQYVFYTTHQVFLSGRAIYLLVTDMSRGIHDRVDDECYVDGGGKRNLTTSEFSQFWLNSIHEFCPAAVGDEPPVVLVGTFADQYAEQKHVDLHTLVQKRHEELKDGYFLDVRKDLRVFESFNHVVPDDFMIDNTVRDNSIDRLKDTIFNLAKQQSYWGEHVPIRWLTLEIELIDKRDKNVPVITLNTLDRMNKRLSQPLQSKEELELFLKFHHEIGAVIYFREDQLREHIIVHPQWLIDAFKCFITAGSICKKNTCKGIFDQWVKLDETGQLTKDIIECVWRTKAFDGHRDLLLRFMEKLCLIARPQPSTTYSRQPGTLDDDFYFVPCLIKETPPTTLTELRPSEKYTFTSKLCFTTTTRFIPTAIVHKIFASCVSKWPVLQDKKGKYQLYSGFGIFELEDAHNTYLYFRDSVLHLWIVRYTEAKEEPARRVCIRARQFIAELFTSQAQMKSNIDTYVKCPTSDAKNMYPFSSKTQKAVTCTGHVTPHRLEPNKLMHYWEEESETETLSTNADWPEREPTSKELCEIAACIGGHDVRLLGARLGLSDARIQQIEKDNSHSVVIQILSILTEWKTNVSQESGGASPASLKALQEVLQAGGMTVDWPTINLKIVRQPEAEWPEREPTSEELREIAACIGGHNVRLLGASLGLSDVRIQHIENDNSNNVVMQNFLTLTDWKTNVSLESGGASPASLKAMQEALQASEMTVDWPTINSKIFRQRADAECHLEDAASKFRSDISKEAGALCLAVKQELQQQGNALKNDTERHLELASSKFKSDISKEAGALCLAVKHELQQQGKTIKEDVQILPQQPGSEKPEQLGAEEQQQTGGEEPQQSGGEESQHPGSGEQQQPGGEEPQQPDGEEAQQPGGEEPQQGGGEEPQQPGGEEPQQPGGEEPQKGGGEEPQQPGGEEPQQHSHGEEPQQPARIQLQQPGGEEPQQPGAEDSQQSNGEESQQLDGKEPQQSGGEEPQQSGGEELQQHGGEEVQDAGGEEPQQPGGEEPQQPDNEELQQLRGEEHGKST